MKRKRIVVGQDAQAVVDQPRIDNPPEVRKDQQQEDRGIQPEAVGQGKTPAGHFLAAVSLSCFRRH
jgi:hypothetical protein